MSQHEWNKKPWLDKNKRAMFPQPDDEQRPKMAGDKKGKPLALWKVILMYVIETIFVVAVIGVLWNYLGESVAILGGIVAVMVFFPYAVRCASQRLRKIRNQVLAEIRADNIPVIPKFAVLRDFMTIFSPTYVLAFGGGMVPYRGAGGIFFIPAVALTIFFGIWQGALWSDLGWRRRYYILLLTVPLLLFAGLGLLINWCF